MTPAEVTRYETHVHDDASALAAEVRRLQASLARSDSERDAQVREAFEAGRFGRQLPSGWVFYPPEFAHNADEAYAAYLATRARVSGDTREEQGP